MFCCVILGSWNGLKAAHFLNIWFGWSDAWSYRVTEDRDTFPEKEAVRETHFYQEHETNTE